jgi:hypothetical protein
VVSHQLAMADPDTDLVSMLTSLRVTLDRPVVTQQDGAPGKSEKKGGRGMS